jgi:Protein of unknown function (DUF962)
MTIPELLQWQWSDYGAKHRNRVNLVIHLFAVPLFMVGSVLVLLGAVLGLRLIAAGVLAMLLAVVLEGLGHRLEAERPAPFRGLSDFARRFFIEQWVTFPRYALGRGWRHPGAARR